MAGHIGTATREDWATPPWLVAAVHQVLGGPPELDPCSNQQSVVGARRAIQLPESGLLASWDDAGSIFVNPPFGRGLARWVGRCVGAWRSGASVLLLLPAAVDTRHWQELVATADLVCFLRGRVSFIGAPAGAPFATAIAFWAGGTGMARRGALSRFREAFSPLGTIWRAELDHQQQDGRLAVEG